MNARLTRIWTFHCRSFSFFFFRKILKLWEDLNFLKNTLIASLLAIPWKKITNNEQQVWSGANSTVILKVVRCPNKNQLAQHPKRLVKPRNNRERPGTLFCIITVHCADQSCQQITKLACVSGQNGWHAHATNTDCIRNKSWQCERWRYETICAEYGSSTRASSMFMHAHRHNEMRTEEDCLCPTMHCQCPSKSATEKKKKRKTFHAARTARQSTKATTFSKRSMYDVSSSGGTKWYGRGEKNEKPKEPHVS